MQDRVKPVESKSSMLESGPFPFVPPPAPPSAEARERFARRRAAGLLAELVAQAVGRSNQEAGTARMAIKLAIEADAMRQRRESERQERQNGAVKVERAVERAKADDGRGAGQRAVVIRGSRTPHGSGPRSAG